MWTISAFILGFVIGYAINYFAWEDDILNGIKNLWARLRG